MKFIKLYGAILTALAALTLNCDGEDKSSSSDSSEEEVVKDFISEYGLVENNNGTAVILQGVEYDLNSALFSDYTVKTRSIYIPEDAGPATYDDNEVFDFPVGTMITKSFAIKEDYTDPNSDIRLIETRVMIRTADSWETLPYVWNEDGTDAELRNGGRTEIINTVDPDGNELQFTYLVPSSNQCLQCHHLKSGPNGEQEFTTIGLKARHLNKTNTYDGQTMNQLTRLEQVGYLSGLPNLNQVDQSAPMDDLSFSLDERARDYLDINCAHCHNPQGTAGITSNLMLNHDNENDFQLGLCKPPGSAGVGAFGLTYDIVPGSPEESILYRRVDTTLSGAIMPLIGRAIIHNEGAQLLSDWITAMDGSCD